MISARQANQAARENGFAPLDVTASADRTIDQVAASLLIGRRTLEGWLAADLLRAVDDRRFQFHVRRGRKRIWSPTAFRLLKEAIERESAPGGALAVSSSRAEKAIGMPKVGFVSPTAAQSACEKVLAWPLRPSRNGTLKSSSRPSSTKSRRKRPAKSGAVIPFP